MKDIIQEQIDNVINSEDFGDLSDYAANLTNGMTNHFQWNAIVEATLEGESIFSSSELIDSLKQLFFYEIKGACVVGAETIILCIFIGLLKNLSSSFETKSAGEIGTVTCVMIIVGIVIVNMQDIYVIAQDTVKAITYTMEVLLPIMFGILISMGKITTGTIMSPLLLALITFFQQMIKNFILPAVYISCVFTLLNCLTEKDYVNSVAKLIRKTALYITGILITLMSGIISVQGLITKTSDGLIMGTAKYSLDTFIPIVGGFTADTIELFLTCMGSIKSMVGIFGILMIGCMILTPILKTIAIALIYKVTSILIEPITTKKIAEGISDVGTTLITFSAILLFAALLFILFIASLMKLGG